jgi:hypothetical protein
MARKGGIWLAVADDPDEEVVDLLDLPQGQTADTIMFRTNLQIWQYFQSNWSSWSFSD